MTTTDHVSQTKSVPVGNFVVGGTQEAGSVSVRMSLTVIERFSQGLYSSPNKAFEELVSNSYDAGAGRVWVSMPSDLSATDAKIVVIDDGTAMNLEGLQDLWQIGESRKREVDAEFQDRKQIGKFGIGKLATFVLATRLTYITHRDGQFLAVTMDYDEVRGAMSDPQQMALLVAELTEEQARETLRGALGNAAQGGEPIIENEIVVDDAPADDPERDPLTVLFGDDAPNSWTAAVLTHLKPTAFDIRLGRLRWILRTAIPLNPNFRLWFNGWQLVTSKIDKKQLWTYTVGKDESQLQAGDRPGKSVKVKLEGGKEEPAYLLPAAGLIWGTAILFDSSLQQGKSDQLGRSHGFFVRVRRRLINIDDPTFDVGPELSHGVFTRFNMVIDADGLDEYVAAPRESLQESPALAELKRYMLAVFNRARVVKASYDTNDPLPLLSQQGRITDPPPALTQGPFRRMLQRAVGSRDSTMNTLGLSPSDVDEANRLLEAGEDLIESVVVRPVGDDERLVAYDPRSKAAVVNQNHPFVANYLDVRGAIEPLKLVALTELLTEAYMLDESISPEQVARVMRRRDSFLRGLVERYPRSAFVVAAQLRAAANDEKRLEDAVADALELLGYDVQRISGTGTPDGVATARLGWRAQSTASESYALTYDAKSSGADAKSAILDDEGEPVHQPPSGKPPRIQAGTTHTSILRVHRERAKEKFNLPVEPTETLLIAPDFQGFDDEAESTIGAICTNDRITPVRVEDLAKLVELFPFRLVSPTSLRTFFEIRHPAEAARYVASLRDSAEMQASTLPLITAILQDYSERKSPVSVASLTTALFERTGNDYPNSEVEAVVRGLAALAPKCLYFDGSVVALNASPRTLYAELGKAIEPVEDAVAQGMRDAIASADKA